MAPKPDLADAPDPLPGIRAVGLALLVAFAVLVGLRLHGFSLTCLHEHLGLAPGLGLLAGTPRPIRSDDWAIDLPLLLAQVAHQPPFPVVNRNVGDGTDMLVYSRMPVLHPLTLFRPTAWGFFLGSNPGLAWAWYGVVLGLFFATFAAGMVLTRGRLDLALLGAALFQSSSFVQLWSYTMQEITAFACLSLALFGLLPAARSPVHLAATAAALAWSLGCLAIHVVYPPFQVPCAWILGAVAAGLALERARDPAAPPWSRAHRAALVVALLVPVAAVTGLFLSSRDAFLAMAESAYPGGRLSLGGGLPAWRLVADNLFAVQASLGGARMAFLGNECEASGFVLLFPPVLLAVLVRAAIRRRPPDLVTLALGLVLLALSCYCLWEIPEAWARLTLLSRVPSNRALLGLGLGGCLLVVRELAVGSGFAPAWSALVALGWTLFLAALAPGLRTAVPFLAPWALVAALVLQGWTVYALLARRNERLALGLVALLGALAARDANPLMSGGVGPLVGNPLSEAMLAADRAAGGASRWAVYGPWPLANLPRILGLESINGSFPHPQRTQWLRFDPSGRTFATCNRFAQFEFLPGPGPTLELVPEDLVRIRLPLSARELETLGVTHLLVHAPAPEPADAAGLVPLASIGPFRVLARPGRAP